MNRRCVAALLPFLNLACSEAVSLGGKAPEVVEVPDGPQPLSFSGVELVASLNSAEKDDNITLSGDMLLACFTSLREGGTGDSDIWCASREGLTEDFEPPEPVTAANAEGFESSAAVSLDGRELWWGSADPEGVRGLEVWHTSRVDRMTEWAAPEIVASLSSDGDDIPRPPGGPGESFMPLGIRRDGEGYRTYLAERDSSGVFGAPELISELTESGIELVDALLSRDGLTLVFTYPGATSADLYFSRRESLDEPFGEPQEIEGVNSEGDDRDPWLSPDGRHLFFASDRSGEFEIYQAQAL